MPTFEEFVQTELPKRPFVTNDGAPGQVLARSADPQHPLELVWVNAGSGTSNEVNYEAGENLTAGQPVKIVADKAYAASHASDPQVIGLVKANVASTLSATIVISGKITLSGLTPGAAYFVGVGAIVDTAPSSGYVIRVGSAITSDTLLINIEEPILLT